MALKECPECSASVSAKAESCPKCGHPINRKSSGGVSSGCGCLIIIGAIFLFWTAISNYGAFSQRADTTPTVRVSDEECMESIDCWFDRHTGNIEVFCANAVEGLARFQARWTDSWLERKFDRASWSDKESGILRVMGNKVQFQNGFGAWQTQRYFCVLEPKSGLVIDAGVME